MATAGSHQAKRIFREFERQQLFTAITSRAGKWKKQGKWHPEGHFMLITVDSHPNGNWTWREVTFDDIVRRLERLVSRSVLSEQVIAILSEEIDSQKGRRQETEREAEERKRLINEVNAILTRVEDEQRQALTPEEETRFNAIHSKVEASGFRPRRLPARQQLPKRPQGRPRDTQREMTAQRVAEILLDCGVELTNAKFRSNSEQVQRSGPLATAVRIVFKTLQHFHARREGIHAPACENHPSCDNTVREGRDGPRAQSVRLGAVQTA